MDIESKTHYVSKLYDDGQITGEQFRKFILSDDPNEPIPKTKYSWEKHPHADNLAERMLHEHYDRKAAVMEFMYEKFKFPKPENNNIDFGNVIIYGTSGEIENNNFESLINKTKIMSEVKTVRAKVKVLSIENTEWNSIVKMQPVIDGSQENRDFHQATPATDSVMNMSIDKDVPASDFFEIGEEIYVDFSKAE